MKTIKVPLFTTKTPSYYKIPPNHMDYPVHRNSTNLGRIPIRSSWMISLFRKKTSLENHSNDDGERVLCCTGEMLISNDTPRRRWYYRPSCHVLCVRAIVKCDEEIKSRPDVRVWNVWVVHIVYDFTHRWRYSCAI